MNVDEIQYCCTCDKNMQEPATNF